jgi:hypothetical protein
MQPASGGGLSHTTSSSGSSSQRSFTAPVGVRSGTPLEGTDVTRAVDAFKYPTNSVDHPDYYSYYAGEARQPGQRVGLPPPRYWSRFAGRVPPAAVLRRLHQEGGSARSRLVTRFVDPAVAVEAEAETACIAVKAIPAQSSAVRREHPAVNAPPSTEPPSALIATSNIVAAAHARLLAKSQPTYVSHENDVDEPPTRPVSSHSMVGPGDSPTRAPRDPRAPPSHEAMDASVRCLQRRTRHYLGVRRGHRALALLHVAQHLGVRRLFGESFPALGGITVQEQLEPATLTHACAVAIEYECRLQSENYARLLLREEEAEAAAAAAAASTGGRRGAAGVGLRAHRAALMLPRAELEDIVNAAPIDARDEAAHIDTMEQLLGSAAAAATVLHRLHQLLVSDLATAKDPVPKHSAPLRRDGDPTPISQLTAADLEPRAARPTAALSPTAVAFRGASLRSTPGRGGPPLDPDEAQSQSELGIRLPPIDKEDDQYDGASISSATPPHERSIGASQFDREAMSTEIVVPRGWAVHSDEPTAAASSPFRDTWGQADFDEGGGFVDLEDLLRHGGRVAAIVRPAAGGSHARSSRFAAGTAAATATGAGECVVCELDAVNTMRCPCGNAVHVDCGEVDITGRTRCCKTCVRAGWDIGSA